jgi:transglutaminase-like putative cysteine protease
MLIRVGCEFVYEAEIPTHAVVQVEPVLGERAVISDETWDLDPALESVTYLDLYGNRCRRLTLPAGPSQLRFAALAEVPEAADPEDLEAAEIPASELPPEVLIYTTPSRFCPADQLGDAAWSLFANVAPGWRRVQTISDWVHSYVRFGYGTSWPTKTAADVYADGQGVCRDFAHLFVAFCRAFSIPTRYVFGYIPDVGVEPSPDPMDFCAWAEVFLSGRWWTFDPRNNRPRAGRVLIGRGRDAVDVAMVTTFGGPLLRSMTVCAERVS